MSIQDIVQHLEDNLPTCPVILDGLAACSAAIDCPHRAECEEKEKALDVILERIAKGDI